MSETFKNNNPPAIPQTFQGGLGMGQKLVDWADAGRTQDIWGDYVRNNGQAERVQPRPFVDANGSSQIIGALTDRVHNLFSGMENFTPNTELPQKQPLPVVQINTNGKSIWRPAPVPKVVPPVSAVPKAPIGGGGGGGGGASGGKTKAPTSAPLSTTPIAPQTINAGYGQYADGSPIEMMTPASDVGLMAGGAMPQLSIADGGQSRLNLNYTPEEMKANQAQASALQTGVPSGNMDFRSDSQKAFDEKAISDIKNPPIDFSKMSMSELMALKASLKQRAVTSQANYQDAAGQSALGNLSLAQNKQPYDIAKTMSDIDTQESTAKIARDKAPHDIDKIKVDNRVALEGQLPQALAQAEYLIANSGKLKEETKWVGTEAAAKALGAMGAHGAGGGGTPNATGIDMTEYAKTISTLQATLPMLEDNPVEKQRTLNLILNLNAIMKENAPKGTIPSKSSAPLPSLY